MSLNRLPNVTQSETVYTSPYFNIRKEHLDCDHDYFIVDAAEVTLQVLASTDDGHYIINREYRHPTGEILLSCPGGLMHEGEELLACARRELLEETGYYASHWEPIGATYPFAGISPLKVVFFRAYHAKKIQEPQLDGAEYLETLLLTEEALKEKIAEGEPVDGQLCSALFFASMAS